MIRCGWFVARTSLRCCHAVFLVDSWKRKSASKLPPVFNVISPQCHATSRAKEICSVITAVFLLFEFMTGEKTPNRRDR